MSHMVTDYTVNCEKNLCNYRYVHLLIVIVWLRLRKRILICKDFRENTCPHSNFILK